MPYSPTARAVLRFIKYNLVNFITFILDLLVIFVLTEFFHTYYLLAVVAGFACEVVAMFFINRSWTFHRDIHVARLTFAALVGASTFVFITVLTYTAVEIFGLYYLLARVLVGILAAVWSYVGDSYFTYQVPPLR